MVACFPLWSNIYQVTSTLRVCACFCRIEWKGEPQKDGITINGDAEEGNTMKRGREYHNETQERVFNRRQKRAKASTFDYRWHHFSWREGSHDILQGVRKGVVNIHCQKLAPAPLRTDPPGALRGLLRGAFKVEGGWHAGGPKGPQRVASFNYL